MLVQSFDELAQNRLESGAIPVVIQLGGALDAGYGVVCGDLGGFVGGFATNQSTNKGRCVDVTGAVSAVCQLFMLVVSIYTVFVHHDAGLAGGVRNTG